MFDIKYHPDVAKDIKKISPPDRERVRKAIETKLPQTPEKYSDHLRAELKNYWKLRVGDYRVVFKIAGKEITRMHELTRSVHARGQEL